MMNTYRDISQVNLAKDLGQVIFCWGDDNNSKDTIKYLKEKGFRLSFRSCSQSSNESSDILGLHAIIYDKVDVLIESKVKLLVVLA